MYLNGGKCTELPSVNDAERFQDVTAAFAVIGVAESRIASVWRILAAILHFGELKFAKGADACKLADPEATANLAAALGVKEDALTAALLVRTITVRGQTTRIPLLPQEARDAADAVAKSLYDRLFKWLVKTMNEKLSQNLVQSKSYIGILDIFGFENFKINSFEQILINYANEKLQQQFNHALFELEQREYVAEGVQWNMVEFADGRDCVELIEDKRGIIALLDEQCRLQQSTDQSLIDKLHEQLASRAKYVKPRLARGEFGVRHYAGEVSYQAAGLLDKNRDTLPKHFVPLLLASEDKLIASVFVGENDDAAESQTRSTVGSVFKKQLADLMQQLSTTHCSYIRCLKPNAEKAPQSFVGPLVAEQLRYSGMLETIRIRKLGYGRRFVFADFVARYAVMLTAAERAVAGADQRALSQAVFASAAMRKSKVPVADAHLIGKTKAFVRDSLMFDLDSARDAAISIRVVVLQAWWRARRERRRFLALRATAVRAQSMWRARQQRKAFLRIRNATIVLQSFARQIKARAQLKHLNNMKRVALAMQAAARAIFSRKTYEVLLQIKRTRERLEREAREKAERERQAAESARLAAEEKARREREVAEQRAKADAERARAEAERARLAADAEAAAAEGARRAELQRLAAAQKAEADATTARAHREALEAARAAEAAAMAAAESSVSKSPRRSLEHSAAENAPELERLRELEASAVEAANAQIGEASATAEAAEARRKEERKAANAAAKRLAAEKTAAAEKAAAALADALKQRKAQLMRALVPPPLRKKTAAGAAQYLTTAAEARAAMIESASLRQKVGTLMRKATLRKTDSSTPPLPSTSSGRTRASSFGARGSSTAGGATLRVAGGTLRVQSGEAEGGRPQSLRNSSERKKSAGSEDDHGDVRETSDSPIWIELPPGRPRHEGVEPKKAAWHSHCVMSYGEVTQKQLLRKKTLTWKERMVWSSALEAPLLSTVTAEHTPGALEMFKNINEFIDVDSKGRSHAGAAGVSATTLAQIAAAQHAIALAWDNPQLRNELYCQVAKQITQCPDPHGALRGWQLMACCCAAFVPTGPLYDAVWDFLTNGEYSKTASSDVACGAVAKLCEALLRITAARGGRALVLTRTEISMLTSLGNKQLGTDKLEVEEVRVPIKVWLDERESVSLAFTPGTTASELLRAALIALRFTEAAAASNEHGYALFERAGRLERSLSAAERVGDVLSKWEAYHKMVSERNIKVADMKIVIRRKLWMQRERQWLPRPVAVAAALDAARRAERERIVADLESNPDSSKKKRTELSKVTIDEAAIERQVDADRRLSFIAARRLVMTGAVHCSARDAVLLATLSLAYEAHIDPRSKVVIREHVPSTSYHVLGQQEWVQMVEDQSMLLPATKSYSEVIDLYMKEVTRLAGGTWAATVFDGVTLSPASQWHVSAPVLSMRVSALGVELRSDETARDVAPLWRLPWSFVDTWERVDDTEVKLSFAKNFLDGPPLLLRSAQAPEIVSLLEAYYKALIVYPLFARVRQDVTAKDDVQHEFGDTDESHLVLLTLEKGAEVSVIEQRPNAVYWVCERLDSHGLRGRVPRAALEALFDDPRLLPDEPIVAVEEDQNDLTTVAAAARTNLTLADADREFVTVQQPVNAHGDLDDNDEDSSSLSESGSVKKHRPKKMCVQCGKKARLMIKFKGDADASPVCRMCADEFKTHDGFASTSAPNDKRDDTFAKMAEANFRKGIDVVAACRWSMVLPNNQSLMPLSEEVDVSRLFDAIKQAMGDTESADQPLDQPLEDLFVAAIEIVLLEDESLRDELYCLLMRQLSHNPNPMSRRRGWLLFDVCSGVVAPRAAAITEAAIEFIRLSPWRSAVPHTLHRLRTLAAHMSDKRWTRKRGRFFGPSAAEIAAARSNTLVPVDVYLAGERPIRIFVEPFASVDETRAELLVRGQLRNLSPEWELCEVEQPRLVGADARRAAPDDGYVVRHLAGESAICDALRRFQVAAAAHTKAAIEAALRSHTSVDAAVGRDETFDTGSPTSYLALFRRVYYTLPERRRILPSSQSEVRLEFLQAVSGVLSGRLAVRHGIALELEALRLQAMRGDRTIHNEQSIRDSGLVGHLPPNTLAAITQRSLLQRTAQLLLAWSAHAGRPPFVCMSQYLSLVKANVRLYGSAFFSVVHKRMRGAETKCWLALNFDGMFLVSRDRVEEQKSLEWWRYSEFEFKTAPQQFNISWGSLQQPKRMFLQHDAAQEISRMCTLFAAGVRADKGRPPQIELHFSTASYTASPFKGRVSIMGSSTKLEMSSSLASLMKPLTILSPEPEQAADAVPDEPDSGDSDSGSGSDDDEGESVVAPPPIVVDDAPDDDEPPGEPDEPDDDADDEDRAKEKSKVRRRRKK